VIEQNHIRGNRGCAPAISSSLPLPISVAGIRPVAALHEFAGDLGARARSQRPQFVKRFLGAEIRRIRRQE
jgi:hypothetical protein